MEPGYAPTRDKRNSVIIRAEVEIDGVRSDRRVRNLSRIGGCIENRGDLQRGMAIYVAMGSLDPLVAEVCWSTADLAGLRFHAEVDMDAARKPRGSINLASSGWLGGMKDGYRDTPGR